MGYEVMSQWQGRYDKTHWRGVLENALFASAFRAAACCLRSSETETSFREVGWTVGDGSDEAGVEAGDEGDEEDMSLMVDSAEGVSIRSAITDSNKIYSHDQ
jgi:hypothetical protein